jgi:hypothetical protein
LSVLNAMPKCKLKGKSSSNRSIQETKKCFRSYTISEPIVTENINFISMDSSDISSTTSLLSEEDFHLHSLGNV